MPMRFHMRRQPGSISTFFTANSADSHHTKARGFWYSRDWMRSKATVVIGADKMMQEAQLLFITRWHGRGRRSCPGTDKLTV